MESCSAVWASRAAPPTAWARPMWSGSRAEPNYAYAAVDLSDAYALNDQTRGPNPYVSKITREFLFVRPLEALIVFDRLEATSASAAKTFLAHFEKAPAVDGDSMLGIDGDQAARVTTWFPPVQAIA